MIDALLFAVIGFLLNTRREHGLLDIPGQVGRFLAASAEFGGRALRCHSFLAEYSWSKIASIISVPIGSFSNGMKFLVRIEYNWSMPFGKAASRFNSSRRSSLVIMIAFMPTPVSFLAFSPRSRSILFRDPWGSCDEATIAVNYQEVTVGNPNGTGVGADDYVHPVVIVPDLSDLHIAQVEWRTKGVDYLFPD
jgi:hypothetical protein